MSNKIHKIQEYYLLCAAGGKAKHSINDLGSMIDVVFTKKEIDLYFRKRDGYYTVKEFIVGGNDDNKQVIIIC